MSDKKIDMYRSHQEGAGLGNALDAKYELSRIDIVGQNGNDGLHYDEPPSKYHVKNIWKDEEWIDFYMYYDQLKLGKPHQVGDSAIEHALKKLSQAGLRSGGKSKAQDIKEAIDSLDKALEMMERFGNEQS